MTASLAIPQHLLPRDGRFGSGPSKVRAAQVDALAAVGATVLGTSHRQAPVRDLVARVRGGLSDLLGAPAGYEVLLGNGGSTSFWDAATFSLIRQRASHAVCGEFSGKFANATDAAPFLDASEIVRGTPGTSVAPRPSAEADTVAWAQNETSTGVITPVVRPAGSAKDALTVVDATSIAGAAQVDLEQADVYYFAPQKALASDGGLWLAVVSPAALGRIEEISASSRWIPDSLSLSEAVSNSRQNQTLNTPAIATLVLLAEQVEWLVQNGGLAWAAQRCRTSTDHLYDWAQRREWASPFVSNPEHRSPVVATIDLDDSLDAARIISMLRDNGILDVFPYRKLGRNQLRVGAFPAVDPADIAALTDCVDFVVENL